MNECELIWYLFLVFLGGSLFGFGLRCIIEYHSNIKDNDLR